MRFYGKLKFLQLHNVNKPSLENSGLVLFLEYLINIEKKY